MDRGRPGSSRGEDPVVTQPPAVDLCIRSHTRPNRSKAMNPRSLDFPVVERHHSSLTYSADLPTTINCRPGDAHGEDVAYRPTVNHVDVRVDDPRVWAACVWLSQPPLAIHDSWTDSAPQLMSEWDKLIDRVTRVERH